MPAASQHRATILTFKVENKLIFQGVVQKKHSFRLSVYQVFALKKIPLTTIYSRDLINLYKSANTLSGVRSASIAATQSP